MPLLAIPKSADKEAALARLERWEQKHAEAGADLAVYYVLVAWKILHVDAHTN
jgi:hypothetical protein